MKIRLNSSLTPALIAAAWAATISLAFARQGEGGGSYGVGVFFFFLFFFLLPIVRDFIGAVWKVLRTGRHQETSSRLAQEDQSDRPLGVSDKRDAQSG